MQIYFSVGDLAYCGFERCVNVSRFLVKHNHTVTINPHPIQPDFHKFDAFIFQRPYGQVSYDHAMRVRLLGKPLILDCDDYHDALPQGNMALLLHRYNANWLKIHNSIIRECDYVTASTEFLAKSISKGKPYRVLKNSIDFSIWDSLLDLKSIFPKDKGELRIGFMGAPSHVNDLKIIERSLVNISNYYPFVKLCFFGYIPEYIVNNLPKDRYIYKEFIQVQMKSEPEYRIFPQELKNLQLDIMVRPLLPIPFNFAKSLQTYLQGSALKIPMVVSDISTHDEIPNDAVVKVKNDETEWTLALKRLIETDSLRTYIGNNAYKFTKEYFNMAINYKQWEDLYQELIDSKKQKRLPQPQKSLYKKDKSLEPYIANKEWIVWLNDHTQNNDGTLDYLRGLSNPKIKVITSETNTSFSQAHNAAVTKADGDYILLLNNDVLPQGEDDEWIRKMVVLMESDKQIGIVAPKLLFPHGRIQSIGTVFNEQKVPYHIYYDQPNSIGIIEIINQFYETVANPGVSYQEKNNALIQLSQIFPGITRYLHSPIEDWKLSPVSTKDKIIKKKGRALRVYENVFEGVGKILQDNLKVFKSGKFDERVNYYSRQYREYQAITAACMLVRREVWEKAGGFDTAFNFNYEDVAMCLATKELGYKIVYCPDVMLMHWECGSGQKPDDMLKNRQILLRKWESKIISDASNYEQSFNYNLYPLTFETRRKLKNERPKSLVSIITLTRNGKHWIEKQAEKLFNCIDNHNVI